MATQTTKQPDVTRDKIVDAAFQEIYRQGFQAASLSNILVNTGLTKGALYHHFPNKSDLGLAVIEEVIREGFEAMMFSPLRESDDPIETLIEVIQRKAKNATLETVSLGCALNNPHTRPRGRRTLLIPTARYVLRPAKTFNASWHKAPERSSPAAPCIGRNPLPIAGSWQCRYTLQTQKR